MFFSMYLAKICEVLLFKNLYAMDQTEYLSRERSSACEGELVSVQKEYVCERESDNKR